MEFGCLSHKITLRQQVRYPEDFRKPLFRTEVLGRDISEEVKNWGADLGVARQTEGPNGICGERGC